MYSFWCYLLLPYCLFVMYMQYIKLFSLFFIIFIIIIVFIQFSSRVPKSNSVEFVQNEIAVTMKTKHYTIIIKFYKIKTMYIMLFFCVYPGLTNCKTPVLTKYRYIVRYNLQCESQPIVPFNTTWLKNPGFARKGNWFKIG